MVVAEVLEVLGAVGPVAATVELVLVGLAVAKIYEFVKNLSK